MNGPTRAAASLLVMLITAVLTVVGAQLGSPYRAFGSPVPAAATPPGAAAAAPPSAGPSPTQDPLSAPRFLTLRVASVSPTVVSAATTEVRVTGAVSNTGDRDVRDVEIRLERAPLISTATELRAALRSAPDSVSSAGPFTPFATRLVPGQSAEFTVTLPVAGRAGASLAVREPGVYPVVVNVNGAPDFGSTARLDVVHFLLPVQTVPAPVNGTVTVTPLTRPVGTPPTLTMLWPLADRPRLLPTAPGSPALLSDDDLAASFAPGGRLYTLLDAVRSATAPAADPGAALGTSLCLAVDPDLLVTAEAMASPGGYQVTAAAGSVSAGTGAAAAARWLDGLRSVAATTCVTAIPWAQADLNATARTALGEQQRIAVVQGAAVVNRVTGAAPVPGLTWPTAGALTAAAAAALHALGQSGVLLSADAVTAVGGGSSTSAQPFPTAQRSARVAAGAGTLAAVLADPASATALSATGANPAAGRSPGAVDASARAVTLQDALGALTWPSLVGGGDTGAPATLVVTPPQVWTVSGAEANTVLGAARALLSANLARPASLSTLVSASATSPNAAELAYPVQASSTELPGARTSAVALASSQVNAFAAAIKVDVQARVTPATLTDPLQQDLVRSLSTTPGAPPPSGVLAALTRLYGLVSLQAPGGPYTLASAQSPLLLVVRNGLPVAVDIQVSVNGPPGLAVTNIGVQQLPANSSRQLVLPTSVARTGQFAVDISLSTASAQSLGPPTRLLVRSTAYGSATAALTGVAALALLALVGRRLWHRFRGQPDPADEGRAPS